MEMGYLKASVPCPPDALDLEMFGEELADFWGERDRGLKGTLPAPDPRAPGTPGVPQDERWKSGVVPSPLPHAEPLWLLPPPWPPCSSEEKEGWEGKPMISLACCQLLRQFLQKGGELWKEGAAWRGGR